MERSADPPTQPAYPADEQLDRTSDDLTSAGVRPGPTRVVVPFPGDECIDESAAHGQFFEAKRVADHDRTRARSALGLLALFGVTTVFALVASMTPAWDHAKDALLIVQPPITLMLGSALTFYYLTIVRGRHD